MNLGLRLGDVFETKKGTYVVTGISYSKGWMIGVQIKIYAFYKDENHDPTFLSNEQIDKNYNNLTYKKNILL